MANQITDNRTLLDAADANTNWVDLAGAATAAPDTEVKIEGTGSIPNYVSNTRVGILYDAGSAQNWSSNTFYFWIASTIVPVLATQANGGLAIRFCGATITDYFEVYLGGKDVWPVAILGQWALFVVGIEEARTEATTGTLGGTGGTAPATTAIRYVGYSAVTDGTMPRMVDNFWIDAPYRLPANTPGVIVEGRNAGTTDWSFADIPGELGTAVGTVKFGDGGVINSSTPIQIGINDTSTHGFTATNETLAWSDQAFVPTDLYGITILGGASGTTNVTWGIKTGTGNDATGAQGVTIQAADAFTRWFLDADDANVDSFNAYGCSFAHASDMQLDSTAVECISTLYRDCESAAVSNSLQLKNTVVDAATADGVAFMTTDDISDIRFGEFQFSDGHAIELITPLDAAQDSTGNNFSGYGAIGTNDAAVYNNQGGAVTINNLSGGTGLTYRNGTSASTTVNSAVTVKVTATDKDTGSPIEGARVRLEAASGGDLAEGTVILDNLLTNASGIAQDTGFNFTNNQPVTGVVRKGTHAPIYVAAPISGTITSSGFDATIIMDKD